MNYPWFRLYSDVLHDKKITRTSVQVKQPKALVLGLWVTILSLANDSPERGKLLISDGIPLTIDEILYEAGLNGEGLPIIEEFVKANMLSIEGETVTVIHWEDRQFASDHSRERVKQYRERKKAVTETGKKRYSNVTVTAQESDIESDSEILSKDNSGKPPQKAEKVSRENIADSETLLADTPESRLLFAKIDRNRAGKGYKALKRFGSLEQKQKFLSAVTRLGYEKLSEGIDAGLANGIIDLKGLVNWIAKYNIKNGMRYGQKPNKQSATPDPGPVSPEEWDRMLKST
jgi:hypothetical protein